MAFNSRNFYCARGLVNCSVNPSAPALHIYNTTDPSSVASQPGYTPPYYGLGPEDIKAKDYVLFQLADLQGISQIIDPSIPTSTGFMIIPQNMVTQNITPQPNEFTGIWSANQPVTLEFIETGILCQITSTMILSSVAGPGVITLTTPPFRFPGSDITKPIIVIDNGVDTSGKITFTASGDFTISPLSGSFSGVGLSGFYGFTFQYNEFIAG